MTDQTTSPAGTPPATEAPAPAPAIAPIPEVSPSVFHNRLHADPTFGFDPWLNEATRPDPAADHEALLATLIGNGAVKTFSGADTIAGDIGLLPAGLEMYASYVDNFGGYTELVTRFGPHFAGLLLSITIFGNPARCADVEAGAMTASDLPHWLDFTALKTGGELPWVYTSASNLSNCNAFIGGRHVVRFSAHYGHGPHVCGPHTCGYPQADWTQWADAGPQGQNYDRSIGTYLPQHTTPPVQASGTWKASVAYDHDKGTMTVTPEPGVGVRPGNIAESVHWDIGLELGGPHAGRWSVSNLGTKQG